MSEKRKRKTSSICIYVSEEDSSESNEKVNDNLKTRIESKNTGTKIQESQDDILADVGLSLKTKTIKGKTSIHSATISISPQKKFGKKNFDCYISEEKTDSLTHASSLNQNIIDLTEEQDTPPSKVLSSDSQIFDPHEEIIPLPQKKKKKTFIDSEDEMERNTAENSSKEVLFDFTSQLENPILQSVENERKSKKNSNKKGSQKLNSQSNELQKQNKNSSFASLFEKEIEKVLKVQEKELAKEQKLKEKELEKQRKQQTKKLTRKKTTEEHLEELLIVFDNEFISSLGGAEIMNYLQQQNCKLKIDRLKIEGSMEWNRPNHQDLTESQEDVIDYQETLPLSVNHVLIRFLPAVFIKHLASNTFYQFVKQVRNIHQNKQVTYLIEGIYEYLQASKKRRSKSTQIFIPSKKEIDQMLVWLQVEARAHVKHTSNISESLHYIFKLTVAIAFNSYKYFFYSSVSFNSYQFNLEMIIYLIPFVQNPFLDQIYQLEILGKDN